MNKETSRKIIVYGIFIILTVFLQFGFHDLIILNGVNPDLFIVFCILTGYLYGTGDAIVIAIISGFLKDSFSGRFLGIGILTCLFCGLIAAMFLKKHMNKNIFISVFQVIAGTIIYSIIIYSSYYLFNDIDYTPVFYLKWIIGNKFLPMLFMNVSFSILYYVLFSIFPPYSKKKSIFDEVIKKGNFSGEFI